MTMHTPAPQEAALVVDYLRYIPLAPLVGVLIHLILGQRAGRAVTNIVACSVVYVSFMLALNAFWSIYTGTPGTVLSDHVYSWISAGEVSVDFSLKVDALSALMCMIVTGVGFLIHVYSTGYMWHDPDYARFFAYLNLFTAAMLLLVLADNLILMFVGWEGVGLCSYLLIGFWYTDMAKASAGKKAFLVNRIGDAAFLIGAFMLFWGLASAGHPGLSFANINANVDALPHALVVGAALLLFVGATGKSAQIPLFVWLPDAMAGPTPVSALIHAATMVTAGIYMVARLNGLYMAAPEAMNVVAVIGATTALMAATIGVAQTDIKKVLAYSTVSQLGYMFLALGVGAFGAAVFHVMTHAFFKALLFLGAGSVIHGLHEEQDIRKMGGLRSKMPHTYWTFAVATLAIAGVPGLSGFFSKDEILAATFDHGNYGLWAMGVMAAGLTAFYMTRLTVLTFFGEFRGGAQAESRIHESPGSMVLPLAVLAVLAAIGGYVGVPHVLGGHNQIGAFLAPVVGHHEFQISAATEYALMAVSVGVAFAGIFFAWRLYRRGPEGDKVLSDWLTGGYEGMAGAYFLDDVYDALVVRPIRRTSEWLWRVFDVEVVDGLANGIASAVTNIGGVWRRWATGNVQHYLLTVLIGVAALVLAVTVRS